MALTVYEFSLHNFKASYRSNYTTLMHIYRRNKKKSDFDTTGIIELRRILVNTEYSRGYRYDATVFYCI